MIPSRVRPTEAEIDLAAIAHNVRHVRSVVGDGVAVMAVVKADGYGHGAVPVARAALRAGATWLGVATPEEGAALRAAGIVGPILVLGPVVLEQIEWALYHRLDVILFDPGAVEAAVAAARRFQRPLGVHLKIDTGMGRVGLLADRFDASWIDRLNRPEILWRGVMSHLAESDAPSPDPTREQLARFLDILEFIRTRRALPEWLHLANSAAALRYPGTHFNLVRFGIGLYGAKPFPAANGLRPALTLRSRVVFVKRVPAGFFVGYGRTYQTPAECWLAAVPIGYADGYRRGLSGQAEVLIRGRRYPVAGRISMDQLTVAVPASHEVAVGDTVTLIGPDGSEAVTAEELAEKAGTISYEIFTGISQRVPRRYRSAH
ncbi:MAG: alanine racemase [Thermaerobacter sp.]|nr:alanine racemase [Thermaerobacter sp.]